MSVLAAPPAADLHARTLRLNDTHAMAAMRARAGRIVRAVEARRRRLVARAVLRAHPRVVADVGCEDGWIAEAYAAHVERVVLCDLDPRGLAAAPLARRAHVDTVVADATAPGALVERLAPCGADVLVLSALLEHLPRPGRALAALAPALAPGGRFVVWLPADGPILLAKRVLKATRLGALVRGLSLEPAPGHLHRFAGRDVVRLLRPHGRIEEVRFDPLCLGWLGVVRAEA